MPTYLVVFWTVIAVAASPALAVPSTILKSLYPYWPINQLVLR